MDSVLQVANEATKVMLLQTSESVGLIPFIQENFSSILTFVIIIFTTIAARKQGDSKSEKAKKAVADMVKNVNDQLTEISSNTDDKEVLAGKIKKISDEMDVVTEDVINTIDSIKAGKKMPDSAVEILKRLNFESKRR